MAIELLDHVATDITSSRTTHSVLVPAHRAGERLLMIGALDTQGDVSSVADLGTASWSEVADVVDAAALTTQYVDTIEGSDTGELPSGHESEDAGYDVVGWVVGVETTAAPTIDFEDVTNNTAALTHAVTVPAHDSGDLLLLLCVSDNDSAPTTIDAINGVAWNKLDDHEESLISGAVYYAVATSNQATSTTVDVTLSSSEQFGARVYRVTNHTGMPEISPRASEHNRFEGLSASWGTNDAVWFYLFGQHGGFGELTSLPTGYTAVQYNHPNGGAGGSSWNAVKFSVGHRIGAAADLIPEFVDVTLTSSRTGAWRVFRINNYDAAQAPEATTLDFSNDTSVITFDPLTPSWGADENLWFYIAMITSSYDISAYPSGYTHLSNIFYGESLFVGYKIATGTTEDPDDINHTFNRYTASMVLAVKSGTDGGSDGGGGDGPGGGGGSSEAAAIMLVA